MRLYVLAAVLLLQHTHALTFPKFEVQKKAPPPAPAPAPFSLFGPTIRKAQIADLEPLAETRLQASPFAAGYAIASRKEAGEKLSDLFCRGIEKGDTVCYLAVENDDIIGSCDVTVRKRLGRGLPKHAYLKNLFVDEAYRRRGIGGKLVAACAEEARRWDVCTLALEVENDNDQAARLYERLGFEEKASLASFESLWRFETFFYGRSILWKANDGVRSSRGAWF
ncbi:unnamed protein product [Pelagomonas calceolata]|uniref:N-acetyltransferase domain-containing protein n=1 Tax=Pelagomonas calceolata TaxID=35677 RepID=A0A8J2SEJ7_9STRA|nr:unnamed protein product [Pelagomonas calceolata]|mmetsp:Transcript_12939/g.39739  ORF Transcript_12939/g.39739 Transcript_12939/m.39739 type:complete len:224 (-) Transcript_12939:4-675(-)